MSGICAFAVAAFLFGSATLLYYIVFLGDLFGPCTVDRNLVEIPATAWIVDLALVALFGVQHSVMARPIFKKWWTGIVPTAAERSAYVLASGVALAILMLLWQPLPEPVWSAPVVVRPVIWGLYAAGWALSYFASFLIDPNELLGLKHAFETGPTNVSFKTPSLYRIVRHPIMLGLLIAHWSAPTMSVGRMLLAAAMTGYILVALQFEEHDLRARHGQSYEDYVRRVPMLVPFSRRRSA